MGLTAAVAFEGGTLFAPCVVTRRQRVTQRDQATTARRARQHRVPQLRGLVCAQPNGGLTAKVEDVLHGACTWTHRFHCAPRPRMRRERRVTNDQRNLTRATDTCARQLPAIGSPTVI